MIILQKISIHIRLYTQHRHLMDQIENIVVVELHNHNVLLLKKRSHFFVLCLLIDTCF